MTTHPRLLCKRLLLALTLLAPSIMPAADSSATDAKSPELAAKLNEVAIAEAEAKLQKALKEIADSKKALDAASNQGLIRAEQEKARAEAEKAVAEADKARIAALLPTSSTKPLEGKIEVDDKAGFLTQVLAQECARQAATEIAKSVSGRINNVDTIYLVRQPDLLKLGMQLKEIENRLALFEKAFTAYEGRFKVKDGVLGGTESVSLAGLSALPSVLGAFADVAALFREDRTLKGRDTNVTDEVLIAAVAGELTRTVSAKVIRPSYVARPVLTLHATIDEIRALAEKTNRDAEAVRAHLATQLAILQQKEAAVDALRKRIAGIDFQASEDRKAAAAEIARLKESFERKENPEERKRITEAIQAQKSELAASLADGETKSAALRAELEKALDGLEKPLSEKNKAEKLLAQVDTTYRLFTEFASKLLATPDSGVSPLAVLAEAALLASAGDNARILTVSVTGQGGELELRKRLWSSGKVVHRAGVACSFALFASDGSVVTSGVVTKQTTVDGHRDER